MTSSLGVQDSQHQHAVAAADPVVKTSQWDSSTSALTVPARTVAVFVQR